MPLLKKTMDLNGATVIVLPKQYTEAFEKIHGVKLKYILMDVNNEIVITPYIPPKEESKKEPKKAAEEITELKEAF